MVGGAGIAERAGQGGEGRKGWWRCQLCCPAPPSSRVAVARRRAAPGVGVALLRGMHARSRAVEGAQQGGDEFAAAFDAAWGAQERYAAAARAMAASNAAASRSGMAASHGEEERSRRLAELRAWSSFEKRKTRVAHSPPRRDAQTPTAERRRRRSSAPPEHARRAHAPATDTPPHAQHRPRPRPASASAVPRATRAPMSGTRASEYVSRSVFDRLYDGPLVVSDSSMCPEKVSQANEWSACVLASVQLASERASRALAAFLKSTAVDALTRKRRGRSALLFADPSYWMACDGARSHKAARRREGALARVAREGERREATYRSIASELHSESDEQGAKVDDAAHAPSQVQRSPPPVVYPEGAAYATSTEYARARGQSMHARREALLLMPRDRGARTRARVCAVEGAP